MAKQHGDKKYNLVISEHQRKLLQRGLARVVPRNDKDADEWATLSALIDELPKLEDQQPGALHDLVSMA